MSLKDFYLMLKKLNIPVAYDHFAERTDCPYLIYIDEGKNRFLADNTIYTKRRAISIELYTDVKDPNLDEQIEALFESAEIIWRDEATVWIEKEQMYLHRYYAEI
ncbi:hypothetical protein ACQRBK_07840 [Peptoniphilaceae bacterium SGI.137]